MRKTLFDPEGNSLERKFFFQWILATTVAWTLTSIALIYDIVSPVWLLPVIGLAQWYILEYYLPKVRWWIWTNILGVVISAAIIIALLIMGLNPNILAHPLLSGVLTGTFVGVLQWFYLRQRVLKAWWWIIANIVGLVLGKIINLTLGTLLGPFLGAVFGGLVFGAVTGLFLIWLLQNPISQRDETLILRGES